MSDIRKIHRILLFASIVFSVMSSLAIPAILIVFGDVTDDSKIPPQFVTSLVFWVGLFGEQAFIWGANAILRRIKKTNKARFEPKVGIIAPFTTLEGMIADIVFIWALIVGVIVYLLNVSQYVQFIMLFLLVLSFRLHCILNGKNYWYSKLLSRRDKNHG